MARNKYPEVTVGRILDVSTQLFMEKGYENTTIQDIINQLGDLSKGAIYHHFKSKEDIISGVIDRMYSGIYPLYYEIRACKQLNGLEKLQKLFHFSVMQSHEDFLMKTLPSLLKNPKFLAIQLEETINELAQELISPIIMEGVEDGSIQTDYPDELAEVMALLANIWLNPFIFSASPSRMHQKCMFFRHIMIQLGVDMFDDELMALMGKLSTWQEEMKEK